MSEAKSAQVTWLEGVVREKSAQIERLSAELAHKDAYYAQFNLTPKPKCDFCNDTGSISDGTACVHLAEQSRAGG